MNTEKAAKETSANMQKSIEHMGKKVALATATAALCSLTWLGVSYESEKANVGATIVQDILNGPGAGANVMVVASAGDGESSLISIPVSGATMELYEACGDAAATETQDARYIASETETERKQSYVYDQVGYINCGMGVNVRQSMTTDSAVVANEGFGEIVYALTEDDGWVAVDLGNGECGYIRSDLVSDDLTGTGVSYYCPSDKRKSYMSWRAITSQGSRQYKLQRQATTASNGARQVQGRYCVAIGQSYNAPVGTLVDAVLADGTVIPCVVGDAKANKDTQGGVGKVGRDGGAVEFIVETSALPRSVRSSGDCSSMNGWSSNVVAIVVYPARVM